MYNAYLSLVGFLLFFLFILWTCLVFPLSVLCFMLGILLLCYCTYIQQMEKKACTMWSSGTVSMPVFPKSLLKSIPLPQTFFSRVTLLKTIFRSFFFFSDNYILKFCMVLPKCRGTVFCLQNKKRSLFYCFLFNYFKRRSDSACWLLYYSLTLSFHKVKHPPTLGCCLRIVLCRNFVQDLKQFVFGLLNLFVLSGHSTWTSQTCLQIQHLKQLI